MQHPLHPGEAFGPVDDGQNPSISRLRKLLNGARKRDIICIMGVKTCCDCTGMVVYILASGLPPVPFLPLAPVFHAVLLKTGEGGESCCKVQSHIYAGVYGDVGSSLARYHGPVAL